MEEKKLLTVQEFCEYIGLGLTLGKKIIKHPKCKFVLKVGRRVFIYKPALDLEIERCVRDKTNLQKKYS